jgi:hypothetical protein
MLILKTKHREEAVEVEEAAGADQPLGEEEPLCQFLLAQLKFLIFAFIYQA